MFRNTFIKRHLLTSTAIFALLLSVMGSAVAQDYTTGALRGLVRDTAGNIVSGASIDIKNNSGTHRTISSDDEGNYISPALPIGAYVVTITAPGYDVLADQPARVQIGATGDYTFTLMSSEGVLEEVFVTGTRQGNWDFNSTTTGISVDVGELAGKFPVARNLTDIALFAPGTMMGDTAFNSMTNGNLASISGASVAENAYYINGMNVTDFRTFTGSSVVPFEFYEQVEVKTGGYQAEFGRSIGGFTNSVTKSGSNDFHAGVTVYWGPDWGEATRKDVENAWNSLDEDNSVNWVLEGSGAIVEDKLFVYGLYTFRKEDQIDVSNSRWSVTEDRDDAWAFKFDWVPFDGHRLEATVWTDARTIPTTDYEFNNGGLDRDEIEGDGKSYIGQEVGVGFLKNGGQNEIFKYTGVLTDWMTISAMYGKNRFERTAQSTNDANPVVYERMTNPSSSTLIGQWNNTYANEGRDVREAIRVDADFYFDLAGDHHLRVGYDNEDLTAVELSELTGGEYWRYHYCTDADVGCFDGQIGLNDEYVRHLIIDGGGTFEVKQTAMYIQDAWGITDTFNLSLGIRNETFDNRNADGETFIKVTNQWAPRLGFTWDPTGNSTDRVYGFLGRYFMPIAANTNIRMAGAEIFIQEYLTHAGFANRNIGIDNPNGVDYDNPLQRTVSGDGTVPPVDTVKDQTVDPLHGDEIILGYEHSFDNGWTAGIRGIYRTLGVQIDDIGINPAIVEWAVDNGWEYDDVSWIIDKAEQPIVYVLSNPGTDMVVATDLLTDDGSLVWMNLTAEQLEYPKPKRTYKALEFTFSRENDGVWDLQGSYTYSTNKGNTEGMVKSDIGQADPGLTQDFDLAALQLNADGPLPTEANHRFKIWGSYIVNDWLQMGTRFTVQSGRKFGCFGVLPSGTYADEDRQAYEARYDDDYWFCGGESTPRGSQLKAPWQNRWDMNFNFIPDFAKSMPGAFTFRFDIFNLLGSTTATDLFEAGEDYEGEGVGRARDTYGQPSAYQSPRRLRLSANWSF
jgi:hypothetical protein